MHISDRLSPSAGWKDISELTQKQRYHQACFPLDFSPAFQKRCFFLGLFIFSFFFFCFMLWCFAFFLIHIYKHFFSGNYHCAGTSHNNHRSNKWTLKLTKCGVVKRSYLQELLHSSVYYTKLHWLFNLLSYQKKAHD